MIFIIKEDTLNKNLSIMNGVAAGVMLATTIWSLLLPSFEYNEIKIYNIIAFSLGFSLLIIFKKLFNVFSRTRIIDKNKMYLAITLHNIPEGLIVGVAFGISVLNKTTYGAAALALAIGIQNFPESMALSILLKNKNMSKKKICVLSLISAVVEPIFGLLGFLLTYNIMTALGILLAFTAGMMLYVLITEMILNSLTENESLGSIGVLIGFIIMMILENYL